MKVGFKMKILVTMPAGKGRNTFITPELEKEINSLGDVKWNTSDRQFTEAELGENLRDIDICITGWGIKTFDKEILDKANKLKLIAHTAGSVSPIGMEPYGRGIKVISGNTFFAESVAEGVIAYILAALRDIPYHNSKVHEGGWRQSNFYNEGLLDQTIGLVSFGMIPKYLVKMLQPFRPKIKVYSGHLTDEYKDKYGLKYASLEEIFATCKIISIHSAKTPKTYHMIGKELLESIPNDSLLINTARGSVIDENALENELEKKRFKAVLDVFEKEPLPQDSKLRGLDNVILMPHMAGPTVDRRKYITAQIIEDIRRFIKGQALKFEIVEDYAKNMTR